MKQPQKWYRGKPRGREPDQKLGKVHILNSRSISKYKVLLVWARGLCIYFFFFLVWYVWCWIVTSRREVFLSQAGPFNYGKLDILKKKVKPPIKYEADVHKPTNERKYRSLHSLSKCSMTRHKFKLFGGFGNFSQL